MARGRPAHPPISQNKNNPTRKERHHTLLEKATFIFAVIAAIATGLAAYFTSQEWLTAGDTERRQLRAYVGATAGDVIDFGLSTQTISFVRKNFGQTPAYDVGFSTVGFSIIPVGQQIPIPAGAGECIFNNGGPNATGLITMFPGTELPFRFISGGIHLQVQVHELYDSQIQSVRDGKFYFVYWGTICYRDTFGESHHTHYCWIYKGDHMTSKDAEGCIPFNDSN